VQQIVPSVLNDPELRFYAGSFTNEAHNEYLQVWNETGIAGLLAYLGVFVCFFINARARFRMQSLDEKLLQISAGASVCVFLLDSLMSFPLRLPSHIAVLMLMLSVPEMDLGETDDATASKFKAGKSWVILMAVAALLIAPVYLKRVGAEYWMKQARTAAESDPVMLGGSVVPVWSAMENEFRTGAMAFSSGNQSVAFPVFAQVRSLAQHPGIKQAAVLFARSLAWDDHYSNASSRYGALLLYEGNYKASIKYLNQALRDLEAFEIHERLGFAYYFSGDFAKAKTEWTICRNRRPALSDYYSGLLKQIKK
jgi:hypothetical protein